MKKRRFKVITYKFLLHILLHLPNAFYAVLFAVVFPIYKALHTKRAYGRVERHLASARKYIAKSPSKIAGETSSHKSVLPLLHTTARDVFQGIFWNALDSYRGLSRQTRTTQNIVFENEHFIRDAIAECSAQGNPIAAISIHQGAFELLHRSLCRYSEHVHLITDSVGDAAFRDILKELRSDPHLTEYHPDETGRLIRELFRTKGILAMVVDQGKHTKGNTVSLFGQPSTLYLRLPQKVNDMGAGIVTFRTWTENDSRKQRKKIVIHFEKYYPPKYGSTGDLVTDIAHEVENWIADHPEQWSWNYHGNFKAGNN